MLNNAQVSDAPVYLDDKSLVGVCNGFDMPELESNTIEHETLGSVGVLKLPTRGLSALDGSMTLSFPEPEIVAIFSQPNRAVTLQVHKRIDVFDGDGFNAEKSTVMITRIKAMFFKNAFASVKKNEATEDTGEFTCTSYTQRLISSDVPLVEVDLFANIYRINGADVWPQ